MMKHLSLYTVNEECDQLRQSENQIERSVAAANWEYWELFRLITTTHTTMILLSVSSDS